jgi:hypothetical protein
MADKKPTRVIIAPGYHYKLADDGETYVSEESGVVFTEDQMYQHIENQFESGHSFVLIFGQVGVTLH